MDGKDARRCAKNTQDQEIMRIRDHAHRLMHTHRLVQSGMLELQQFHNVERSIWILISRGHETFVNGIHRHNFNIVNYSSSLRRTEENLHNVGFEYFKLAVVNHEQGLQDSKKC